MGTQRAQEVRFWTSGGESRGESPRGWRSKVTRGCDRGRGLGSQGVGLVKRFCGVANRSQGARPVCLRGSTDSGHGKTSAGPWAKSGSRDPARFTFFLAAANLLCRVSSDIPGHGGGEAGPHHLDPGTHCGSIR